MQVGGKYPIMKRLNKIRVLVSLITLLACQAFAGSLGATSTDNSIITLEVGATVQITNVDDIALGAYSGTGVLSGSTEYCVHKSGGDNYTVTLTTDTGSFKVSSVTTGDDINFTAKIDDDADASDGTAVAYNIATAAMTGAATTNCGALAIIVNLADRSSDELRDRVRAEHQDPTIVIKMYLDIESGEETAAWHAIGLLANYRNPAITKNMLEMVQERINDRDVITVDRLAVVRHTVKCIMSTGCDSCTGQLLAYAKDMDSDIGVQVRRMQMDGVEFTLK